VSKIVIMLAVSILVVHGIIHLMGTAVYMKLAEINGLSYKTTLLSGRLDLGEGGSRVFGALWVLPAIGFIVAALALLEGWEWWQPVMVGVTLLSLALTGLDWSGAFMGAIIDIAILALLWLGPRIAGWFA